MSSVGILTVMVSRNIRAPTFNPDFYTFNIPETTAVTEILGAITLTDPDLDVSQTIGIHCACIGGNPDLD